MLINSNILNAHIFVIAQIGLRALGSWSSRKIIIVVRLDIDTWVL
jgi:hypothetical protein